MRPRVPGDLGQQVDCDSLDFTRGFQRRQSDVELIARREQRDDFGAEIDGGCIPRLRARVGNACRRRFELYLGLIDALEGDGCEIHILLIGSDWQNLRLDSVGYPI